MSNGRRPTYSVGVPTCHEGGPGGGGRITDLGWMESRKMELLDIETSRGGSAGVVSPPSPEVCKWRSKSNLVRFIPQGFSVCRDCTPAGFPEFFLLTVGSLFSRLCLQVTPFKGQPVPPHVLRPPSGKPPPRKDALGGPCPLGPWTIHKSLHLPPLCVKSRSFCP